MLTRPLIKQAINLLMSSPFYFRMDLPDRKKLIEEFCRLHFNTERSCPWPNPGQGKL